MSLTNSFCGRSTVFQASSATKSQHRLPLVVRAQVSENQVSSPSEWFIYALAHPCHEQSSTDQHVGVSSWRENHDAAVRHAAQLR